MKRRKKSRGKNKNKNGFDSEKDVKREKQQDVNLDDESLEEMDELLSLDGPDKRYTGN